MAFSNEVMKTYKNINIMICGLIYTFCSVNCKAVDRARLCSLDLETAWGMNILSVLFDFYW